MPSLAYNSTMLGLSNNGDPWMIYVPLLMCIDMVVSGHSAG